MSSRGESRSNSSFIFGLILGLIVGAVAAVIIYKNRRSKVFRELKKQLAGILEPFFESTSKHIKKAKKLSKKVSPFLKKLEKQVIPEVPQVFSPASKPKPAETKRPVIIPDNLPVLDITPPKPAPKAKRKMFLKVKK